MATSYILDSMCKKVLLLITLTIFAYTFDANAQSAPAVNAPAETSGDAEDATDNPDEAGVAMPTDGMLIEDLPIDDIIEGVGTMLANGVYFRAKPDDQAKSIRLSVKGEKVLILGVSELWLRVRMFNNQEAYINRKYVKMEKVYNDEALIGSVDKKLYLELNDIIQRFNATLTISAYASKFHIFPYVKILDSKKSSNRLTLTLLYTSMNTEGKIVPSMQDNLLRQNMISFLELVFSKLLLANIDVSDIIINVPNFSPTGQVVDTNKFYAKMTLVKSAVNLKEVNKTVSKIWKYVVSSIERDKLFEKYPTN